MSKKDKKKQTYNVKTVWICMYSIVRVCSSEKYSEIHLEQLLFIKVQNVLLSP